MNNGNWIVCNQVINEGYRDNNDTYYYRINETMVTLVRYPKEDVKENVKIDLDFIFDEPSACKI